MVDLKTVKTLGWVYFALSILGFLFAILSFMSAFKLFLNLLGLLATVSFLLFIYFLSEYYNTGKLLFIFIFILSAIEATLGIYLSLKGISYLERGNFQHLGKFAVLGITLLITAIINYVLFVIFSWKIAQKSKNIMFFVYSLFSFVPVVNLILLAIALTSFKEAKEEENTEKVVKKEANVEKETEEKTEKVNNESKEEKKETN